MDEAGLVQVISFVAVASFAVTFLLISAHSPAFRYARWFAAAFILGAIIQVLSYFVPAANNLEYPGFIRASLILAASCSGLVGALLTCGMQPRWRLLGSLLGLATLAAFLTVFLEAPIVLRSLAFQAPPAFAYAAASLVFITARDRGLTDWLIGLGLAAMALNVLSRPLAVFLTSDWATADRIAFFAQHGIYWKFASGVLGVVLGLFIVIQILRDIVARSQTDKLSSLLNRAAFEEKVEARLKEVHRIGIPACLVVADLDRFKLINDRYGHAAGDEVIVGFADIIRQCQTPQVLAGRLGGEEFGIFVEGANLTAAEVFAEGIRAAFSVTPHSNAPAGIRFTASLGVALLQPEQGLPELMRRADAALYDAKTGGRDQVRLAPSITSADLLISEWTENGDAAIAN
jgi:diguanylate cyclase (GGDEF)-like protein